MTPVERFRQTMARRVSEGGKHFTRVRGGVSKPVFGRVAQMNTGAWSFSPVDDGVTTGRVPYFICAYDTSLQSGDILVHGAHAWQCDEVSYPERFGEPTHCQAALHKVSYGK
jgi:hypothetical protein